MELKLNKGVKPKMGSYISIGFVYNMQNVGQIKKELELLVTHLISKNGSMKNIKVSKDSNGEKWVEYNTVNNLQMSQSYGLLAEYYYGQLDLICSILGKSNLEVVVRIEKEEDYFGFLLDIKEDELIKANNLEAMNGATDEIISFITNWYNVSRFDYAFCDNEAEIQCSPKEVSTLKNAAYSIFVVPSSEIQNKALNIIKNNWNIDGLTTRN